MQKKNLR